MTMNEKMLDKIEDITLDMRTELDGIKRLAQLIEDDLFYGRSPDGAYTNDFEKYQALYHMMTNALYKFEGEFYLLTGEDETHYYKCISQLPDKLREINHWWNAPQKEGAVSV